MASRRPSPRTAEGLLKLLTKRLPATFPVKLEWRERLPLDSIGDVNLEKPERGSPYFLMRLSRQRLLLAPRWSLFDTIIHEYGHALAWTPEHLNLKDHGSLWAIAHGLAYQIYCGEVR